jgi:hypothetical protein
MRERLTTGEIPFRDLNGVVHLDAEVADGALDPRMAQQQLHSAQIASAPVDQHGLRTSQGVGCRTWQDRARSWRPIHGQAGRTASSSTHVDHRGDRGRAIDRASVLSGAVLVDGRPGLVCEFEPYQPARLALPDGCPIHGIPTRRHVIHAKGYDIASAQLAIDSEIEQREIALASRHLQLCYC